MSTATALPLSASQLPGTHRTRVFVGGRYANGRRSLLALFEQTIRSINLEPIIADQFQLPDPTRDIHDLSLFLLHSCRLAIFETSTVNGALMEIERISDYSFHRALLLYQHPAGRRWPKHPGAWRVTTMLTTLAREQQSRFVVRPYVRPQGAQREIQRFLVAVRRSAYGKLHRI